MKTAIGFLLLCLSPLALSQSGSPWVEQVSGLSAGLGVVALHAADSNTVWAAFGVTSPVVGGSRTYARTTNGGTTWISGTIAAAPTSYGLGSVFAFDANKAWVTMWSWQTTGGILGTTDGGLTWTQDPTSFKTAGGWPDFIHFFDANNGVCVGDPTNGYFEIYTTSNAGASWSRVPQANIPAPVSGEKGLTGPFFAAAGNSLWFPTSALGTGRIFRTTDKGLTWSLVMYPGIAAGWYPAIAFQDENVGIGNGDWGDVKKTTDGGSTWTAIPTSPSLKLGIAFLKSVPHRPGMYVASASLQYNSLARKLLYGTFYTLDEGVHWTIASASTSTVESTPDLAFSSPTSGWRGDLSPNIFKWTVPSGRFAGVHPDSLVFDTLEVGRRSDTIAVDFMNYGSDPVTLSSISTLGAEFTVTQQPTLPSTIPSLGSVRVELCYSPSTSGTHRDSLVFVSNASNASRASLYLEGSGVVFHPAENGKMYAASASLYSINAATHTPTTIGSLGSIQFGGLTIHPKTNVLHGSVAGATTTTVYRVCCATALTGVAKTFPVGNMQAIAFNHDGELYGASTSGRLYRLNLATGDTIGIGTAPGVAYGSIAFSPSGKLWASVNSGSSGKDAIYTVNTTTGAATQVGSTGDNTYNPAIFMDQSGVLYGLKAINTRTPNIVIRIDTVNGKGDSLFSTGMKGITSMTMLSFTSGVAISPDPVPTGFRLGQNYPNPFNPTTTIRYALPHRSHVTLTVFNTLGQQVAQLINGDIDAGYHEIQFNATNLASGVYFYRIQAGSYVETKTLCLVK